MAKAIEGTVKGPQDLPNQHANNQTETPEIPTPRNGHSLESLPQIKLFTTHISEQKSRDAADYIEASIRSVDTIRIGTFIIHLLERLESIPTDISAEETDIRATAILAIEQLLIDYEVFAHPSGKGYDTARFSQEVTDKIDDDSLEQYALVAVLSKAIQRVRARGNRSAEPLLVTAQRITMLGIAKQRGVYQPQQ